MHNLEPPPPLTSPTQATILKPTPIANQSLLPRYSTNPFRDLASAMQAAKHQPAEE